jgi:hypothetical protein
VFKLLCAVGHRIVTDTAVEWKMRGDVRLPRATVSLCRADINPPSLWKCLCCGAYTLMNEGSVGRDSRMFSFFE